jgi:hypothetical protein
MYTWLNFQKFMRGTKFEIQLLQNRGEYIS